MKLSTRARYGLRAMVDLALHRAWPNTDGERRALSLSEISERQHVPIDYLRQIFLRLKRTGLVRSVRGRAGGYLLTKSPGKTNALEVVEALGEELAPVFCISSPEQCEQKDVCSTRPLWSRLYSEIRNVLAVTSIAQLAAECPKNGIASLPKGHMFDI